MNIFQTEGIILSDICLQRSDKVIKLFSSQLGVVDVFVQGGASVKKAGLTSPLTRIECHLRRGNGDLWQISELQLLDSYQDLRKNLLSLQSSSECLRLIQSTQEKEKLNNNLYKLLCGYLKKMECKENCNSLLTSFYLKLMAMDGQLNSTVGCDVCSKSECSIYYLGGQAFCQEHKPPFSVAFTEGEVYQLLILAFSRSFSEILSLDTGNELIIKVKKIFLAQYDLS